MSQISGSVTLDVELGRVGDLVAGRVLAAVQDADLVGQAARLVAEKLATPPVLWSGLVVSCTGSFETGQAGWYGFEFQVPVTGARFVLYADLPHQYLPGVDYTLSLALLPTGGDDQPSGQGSDAAASDDGDRAGGARRRWFGGDDGR